MGKHVTQWEPDTCGCVLRYEWDDTQSPEERLHVAVEHIHTCDAHAHMGTDHHDTLAEVLDENRYVNKAREIFGQDVEFNLFPTGKGAKAHLHIGKHRRMSAKELKNARRALDDAFPHRSHSHD